MHGEIKAQKKKAIPLSEKKKAIEKKFLDKALFEIVDKIKKDFNSKFNSPSLNRNIEEYSYSKMLWEFKSKVFKDKVIALPINFRLEIDDSKSGIPDRLLGKNGASKLKILEKLLLTRAVTWDSEASSLKRVIEEELNSMGLTCTEQKLKKNIELAIKKDKKALLFLGNILNLYMSVYLFELRDLYEKGVWRKGGREYSKVSPFAMYSCAIDVKSPFPARGNIGNFAIYKVTHREPYSGLGSYGQPPNIQFNALLYSKRDLCYLDILFRFSVFIRQAKQMRYDIEALKRSTIRMFKKFLLYRSAYPEAFKRLELFRSQRALPGKGKKAFRISAPESEQAPKRKRE